MKTLLVTGATGGIGGAIVRVGVRRTSGRFLAHAWVELADYVPAALTARTDEGLYPHAGVPWFSDPFGRDAPKTALHHHRGFSEALERLRFTVEIDGISALVAEPGCGKSLLLGQLADDRRNAGEPPTPYPRRGQSRLSSSSSTRAAARLVATITGRRIARSLSTVETEPREVAVVAAHGLWSAALQLASELKAPVTVVRAWSMVTAPRPDGLGMSARGITVSTVGLVPRMQQLAAEGLPVTLALSLHAPDDELRDTLVPVNTRWKVREVLDAGWEYAAKSGRRLSIEYALIRDINDQAWRGDRLGRLLRGKPVHVNLIPLNPTPGSKWTASRPEDEKAFVEAIAAHGVPVTVRDTRGQEIDGACGQLAAAER